MVSWTVDPAPPDRSLEIHILLTSYLHLHSNHSFHIYFSEYYLSPLVKKKQCLYKGASFHVSLSFSFVSHVTSVCKRAHLMIILVRHLAMILRRIICISAPFKPVRLRTGHGAILEVKRGNLWLQLKWLTWIIMELKVMEVMPQRYTFIYLET